MTKFTYEWFLEQSRAADRSVKSWPSDMQRNIMVAVASLPIQPIPESEKAANLDNESSSQQSAGESDA